MRSPSTALAICVIGLGASLGCTDAPSPRPARAALEEPPLVNTTPWLETVSDPPPAWRRFVEGRRDVLRHRFVRFRRPASLPPARARFLIRPFADTELVLQTRRAGPVGVGAYSWFGALEGDPRGFGGIVVRPSGRVAASITTSTRRFEVVNVGSNAYAILELDPPEPFRCGFEHETASGG
jgi:hypothetical protein